MRSIFAFFFIVSCGFPTIPKIINANLLSYPLRWSEEKLPLKVKMSERMSEETRAEILRAQDKWEAAAGVDFFGQLTTTPHFTYSDISSYRDLVDGVYEIKHPFPELRPQMIAVTQIWFQETQDGEKIYNEITEIDIFLNGNDYAFSNDPEDLTSVYLPKVLLHEFGHALGLLHTETGVMAPTTTSDDKTAELEESDVLSIREKYAPVIIQGLRIERSVQIDRSLKRILVFHTRG